MDPIPTVAENFEQFAGAELPGDPPEVVLDFIRAAFYAGAGSTLRAVDVIKRTADTPLIGIAALAMMEAEVNEFAMERVNRAIAERLGRDGTLVIHIRRVEE
jgi:hypothetical protein